MSCLQMGKPSGAVAREEDNFIFLSVFLSCPNLSESHPSSGAVSEEIHSNLVQMAVKNHINIKIMWSIPCLCCFPFVELSCPVAPSVVSDVDPKILWLSVTTVLHSYNWLFGSRKEQIFNKPFWGFWYFDLTYLSPSMCSANGWARAEKRGEGKVLF